MRNTILMAIGFVYSINAVVMWLAPIWWYETIPGISMMGPANLHFLRDIGLIYLVSGLGLLLATRAPQVALFACLWPALHAVFHAWIFVERGMPLDLVAAVNLFLIQLPAWLALWIAASLCRATREGKNGSA